MSLTGLLATSLLEFDHRRHLFAIVRPLADQTLPLREHFDYVCETRGVDLGECVPLLSECVDGDIGNDVHEVGLEQLFLAVRLV